MNKEIDKAGKESFGARIRQRFRQNKAAWWSWRLLGLITLIGLLSGFFANEKPIYCQWQGKTYFPIIKHQLVQWNLDTWPAELARPEWKELNYEKVVWPAIPYSPQNIDIKNRNKGPFDKQEVKNIQFRHWLGTDDLGRDVSAGMFWGLRTALGVGFFSMLVACLIGILLGAVAGYFADDTIQISALQLILNLLALPFALFYGFIARSQTTEEVNILYWLTNVAIFLGMMALVNWVMRPLKNIGKKFLLPAGNLIMRAIEVIDAVPALFLLLALLAVIEKPSIWNVMFIIALVRWPVIARFVRAELLKIRNLPYLEAAKVLGYSHWRILSRHALPNALAPVLIIIAFGIADAVLLEAFISFLGVGLPPEEVTWGVLLNLGRQSASSWWLAVFPGMAIFVSVTLLNLIGEGLTEVLDPKLGRSGMR